jgi:alpha-tubulin suppressor-like RCC1 family protein
MTYIDCRTPSLPAPPPRRGARVRRFLRRLAPVLAPAVVAALGCREDAESPTAPGPEAGLDITPAAALSFLQLSAGSGHTCGVTTDNLAYCWGSNFIGQLGDGTSDFDAHPRPVLVAGGLQFRQVDAGDAHTCGVTTSNRVYCWGDNRRGQLGDGTRTGRPTPVAVASDLRFLQVSTGLNHSCGLTTGARAFCWGANSFGQLGIGTFGRRLRPAAVAGGLQFTQIATGALNTCGVTTGNLAYCWGRNEAGALGDGTISRHQLAPVAVVGGLQFRLVHAAGLHSCGVALNDLTYCWGVNGSAQLGIGTDNPGPYLTPQRVHAGGVRFRLVRASGPHTCGATMDNRAYCWGDNTFGEVGDGTTTRAFTPVPVAGGLAFSGVTAGPSHTCGRTTDAQAYCWGYNGSGQLGDGTTVTPRLTPVPVASPGL